ncbi:hypothetical protein [Streptomyces telluris]|uniref:Uncharacterized protein n=1 Tax=Streptomyces telluris TaxID=2720021 RepID=A0A9X2LG49_9ACTN|nr:hypothetical protein [Streptomyces telluris]MCQ8770543.1 hypothetical protein [Streptomyces telluris]NJP82271.1 hypothetical protein [Streptomyces telluris]
MFGYLDNPGSWRLFSLSAGKTLKVDQKNLVLSQDKDKHLYIRIESAENGQARPPPAAAQGGLRPTAATTMTDHRTPALVSAPAHPMGNPRRHPRSVL